MKIIRLVVFDLVICLASGAWGQAPVPPAASGATDRPVRLDVVVTDKSGTPVSGLQQPIFAGVVERAKGEDRLWLLVIENSKVRLLQARNGSPGLVCHHHVKPDGSIGGTTGRRRD